MPERTNSTMKPTTKAAIIAGRWRHRPCRRPSCPRVTRTPAAKTIATNVYSVILPPPMRSASLPPNGRAIEPSSGPMKAIWAACSAACAAVSPPARKLICST